MRPNTQIHAVNNTTVNQYICYYCSYRGGVHSRNDVAAEQQTSITVRHLHTFFCAPYRQTSTTASDAYKHKVIQGVMSAHLSSFEPYIQLAVYSLFLSLACSISYFGYARHKGEIDRKLKIEYIEIMLRALCVIVYILGCA